MSDISIQDKFVNFLYPARRVYAHCDIPCGIYDPHQAQIAALTAVRMNQLIKDLPKESSNDSSAKLVRYVNIKEEHAELCKKELRILWADYFKPEHVEKHPELHDIFWKAMKTASKTRQDINLETSEELLEAVRKIAEIFWSTKGAKTKRQASLQASGGELVYPISE